MKATIEVTNKREAELVRQALADPETRCVVNVIGALQTLPDAKARSRVLTFVAQKLDAEETS